MDTCSLMVIMGYLSNKTLFCYNFSLYLELQKDLSQAIEMYETALSSLMKAEEICMVWLG